LNSPIVVESYLVYWEDESSVTAVSSSNVKNKVVEEISSAKLGNESFDGRQVRSCEHNHLTKHFSYLK